MLIRVFQQFLYLCCRVSVHVLFLFKKIILHIPFRSDDTVKGPTKTGLLQALTKNNVLEFREVVLKSGRISPYFFNGGSIFQDPDLTYMVADAFAKGIMNSGIQVDLLFGPPYKGMRLADWTSSALLRRGRLCPATCNRKEIKHHGEGGLLIGPALANKRIVIVDDVITAGTALRESIEIIKSHGGLLAGVFVVLDRQEVATNSTLSTIAMVSLEYNVKVVAILKLDDIIEFGQGRLSFDDIKAMERYRKSYGA